MNSLFLFKSYFQEQETIRTPPCAVDQSKLGMELHAARVVCSGNCVYTQSQQSSYLATKFLSSNLPNILSFKDTRENDTQSYQSNSGKPLPICLTKKQIKVQSSSQNWPFPKTLGYSFLDMKGAYNNDLPQSPFASIEIRESTN